jgi:hypothetical protein
MGGEQFVPAFRVEPVDTVAADDAFNGALAEGLPFVEAMRWGLAAGARTVTKAGAQPSMPTRAEVKGMVGRGHAAQNAVAGRNAAQFNFAVQDEIPHRIVELRVFRVRAVFVYNPVVDIEVSRWQMRTRR